MKINLLPKKEKPVHRQLSKLFIWGVIGLGLVVFGVSFYIGCLYQKITVNEGKIAKLETEAKCYHTLYRKAQNIEALLGKIRSKQELKKAIFSSYLKPSSALKTLIDLRPDLVWFQQIKCNTLDGSFTLKGSAANYKILAGFIAQLEQDRQSFARINPEKATTVTDPTGREIVRFIITGVLEKGVN
ncbi:MAG: PilN domain-containing protein [Bacillota bacterium]